MATLSTVEDGNCFLCSCNRNDGTGIELPRQNAPVYSQLTDEELDNVTPGAYEGKDALARAANLKELQLAAEAADAASQKLPPVKGSPAEGAKSATPGDCEAVRPPTSPTSSAPPSSPAPPSTPPPLEPAAIPPAAILGRAAPQLPLTSKQPVRKQSREELVAVGQLAPLPENVPLYSAPEASPEPAATYDHCDYIASLDIGLSSKKLGESNSRDNMAEDTDEVVPSKPSQESLPLTGGETEGESEPADVGKETRKALCFALFMFTVVGGTLAYLRHVSLQAELPDCLEEADDVTDVCAICSREGVVFPLFGDWEQTWNLGMRAILYFLALAYTFLGVGMICDRFMASIEEITSSEGAVWIETHAGTKRKFNFKIWNPTVANLTLMALGSSAPEILLSVIEVVVQGFFSGDLGPSTIVGSAAFNLFVITAVCVSAIPAGETRLVQGIDVYIVTTTFSLFAYVWMVVMLQVISPDRVEMWEACLTLSMFPLLIIVAFWADKGHLRRLCGCGAGSHDPNLQEEKEDLARELGEKYNAIIPNSIVEWVLKEKSQNRPKGKSRFEHRFSAMTRLSHSAGGPPSQDAKTQQIGNLAKGIKQVKVLSSMAEGAPSDGASGEGNADGPASFGFTGDGLFEAVGCCGLARLKIMASRATNYTVQMRYRTRDGSAYSAVRFVHTEGLVRFAPGQTERLIDISILDFDSDDGFAQVDSEDFYVDLFDLEVWSLGKHINSAPEIGVGVATIRVINVHVPSVLDFDSDEFYTEEGCKVRLGIFRSGGCRGNIYCQYKTQDGSAVAGKDYVTKQGTLMFMDGERHKSIEVEILESRSVLEGLESFKVILEEPSQGCCFDPDTAGGEASACADVVIQPKVAQNPMIKCMRRFWNKDKMLQGLEDWKNECLACWYVMGSPEEQSTALPSDWALHGASLAWNIVFMIVPPASVCGGWACFTLSLSMIGVVTLLVIDLAKLLGCCIGLPNDVTAITLVALGTSLPDTFASKMAAKQDETADNSVGNVTGSNSVNVFLGLGLPWLLASAYWEYSGVTPEWLSRKNAGKAYRDTFYLRYPEGGFIVPAGSLSFSVIVFMSGAVVCIALLAYRRIRYGGELGGSSSVQTRDSILIGSLWVAYLVASIARSLSVS
eukprot:TRINITY_DN6783_c0_g1_i1.p1 TRINITY_DN6783_c0_g1~~TRINITY_DN6783_c0_g1_i1.p1  ORF type:complete len:1134 (+),score=251.43 TRINITY_DN6783_c0_g1_i1:196-3597(+)